MHFVVIVQGADIVSSCEDQRDNDSAIPAGNECIDDIRYDVKRQAVYIALNAILGFVGFIGVGIILGYLTGWSVLRIRTSAFSAALKQEVSFQNQKKKKKIKKKEEKKEKCKFANRF